MTHPAEFNDLPLDALEEASGELHRRIAVALRRIGEARADDAPAGAPRGARSPRQEVATLAVLTELAAMTCASVAAGVDGPAGRLERHPAAVAAVMYAAPTLAALLSRLEQDRRLLASHARGLASRLDAPAGTAWAGTLREMLTEVAIVEPARVAQSLDLVVAALDEEEQRLIEAAMRNEDDV